MAGPIEIDVETYAAWRDEKRAHTLLDVREGWEHDTVAIAGDVNIPMSSVPNRISEISKDQPVVVMCHHGGRSRQVMQWLRQQGYDAINLEGGIDAWSREIDSSLPRY